MKDYRETAGLNEEVLQAILEDMKSNKQCREMGRVIPADLDTCLGAERLFHKYSTGERYGMFTVLNFQRPDAKTAVISFQNVGSLSGGGANLLYEIDEIGGVKYKGSGGSWMS